MSEATDSNQLLRYYRRYIGDPDRTVDVYAGFGLFFVGLVAGAVSVVVFLYSATLPAASSSSYAIREVAGVASAVGFPALLLGIVVLLPVDKRMLYVAAAGSVIDLVAVGLFVWAYPQDWNVTVPPDYSAQVIALYSVGIALVVAATGAALVAHRVERAVDETGEAESTEADAEETETVSDEQVRSDIDSALDDAELSWGGVSRTETRRLNLDTSAIDDIDSENLPDSGIETRTSDGNVSDAVSQLQGLQGGEVETASGEGTDDQAAALRELREQQREEEEAEAAGEGLIDRIRGLF
ncbi:permease [Halorubrum sp. SD690R]|uniref:DUF7139 domain-containing protein n=1 Tax=Halorubrum sp. SD690R TaxID=2518117 RepID=UPI0010F5B036|nr:permease [Halorubrum sp. SD690R]TKX46384.1 permease [Halorubrum sp. SD690R]